MKSSGEQSLGKFEQENPSNRYEALRRYEKLVKTVLAQCIELQKQTFESSDDAEEATYPLSSHWSDQYVHFQKTTGDIPVRMAGDGVHEPHVNLQAITSGPQVGVFVGVDANEEEELLHPLPMFESKTGYIQSLIAKAEHDQEADTYSTSFQFLMRDEKFAQMHLADPRTGLPIVAARLQRYFLADCSNDTIIEFPATERLDARRDWIKGLKQNELVDPFFVSEMNKVSAALYRKNAEDSQELRAMERVRWIASQAERLVAEGVCRPDEISNALLSMFGKHRFFEIEGTQVAIGQPDVDMEPEICDGTIEDVFMHSDDTHSMTPVLAFVDSDDIEGRMKYFLLKEVRSIKF